MLPDPLIDARLQAHWALQLASTIGRTTSEPAPDDSHAGFRWSEERRALRQENRFRAGLRIHDLTLLVGEETFPLDGCTFDEGWSWIEQRVPGVRRELDMPMPHHQVADGAPFVIGSGEGLAELSADYSEAAGRLSRIHADVRCWPHHFDIATLIALGEGRTIGVGMSPGDELISEPYWYVNHYPPTPRRRDLPQLAGGGRWQTFGWVGAVRMVHGHGDPDRFLASAIAASRTLVQAGTA